MRQPENGATDLSGCLMTGCMRYRVFNLARCAAVYLFGFA
ncbi:hypothetical protein GCWU000324_00185 [Kingella oralis ATCC 51147]|uniref:Uncharacterized protein n=1 Tax=Kingella oralis ATCC 51147 TaxID=629741 RepID=C4GH55_9NEIS|nr:hypothetical protein GCWU000324_00185 [Kingella oralis ATCC 51147]